MIDRLNCLLDAIMRDLDERMLLALCFVYSVDRIVDLIPLSE
jgi:hypothetical protein